MLIHLLSLAVISTHCYAQDALVQPIGNDVRIEEILNAAQSRATAEFTEKATSIELTYSSPSDLNVLILFVYPNGQFDPLDSLLATLPSGTRQTASIDLTISGGWTPRTRTYRLHFLSNTSEGASFEDIEFTGGSVLSLIGAAVHQLVSPLPYTPASYHRLSGYRVLGLQLVPALGVLLLVISLYYVQKKKYRFAIGITILLVLLYGVRFAGDEIAYSLRHTAGALPEMGKDLIDDGATGVLLCHSGTTYARRLLSYHAYPVQVTTENPSHAALYASTDWSYDRGMLRCDGDNFRAKKLKDYADGSALFSLTAS